MSLVACPNCQHEDHRVRFRVPRVRPDRSDRCIRTVLGLGLSPVATNDAVAALLLAVAALFIWPLAILAVVYGLAALRTLREQKDRYDAAEKGRDGMAPPSSRRPSSFRS